MFIKSLFFILLLCIYGIQSSFPKCFSRNKEPILPEEIVDKIFCELTQISHDFKEIGLSISEKKGTTCFNIKTYRSIKFDTQEQFCEIVINNCANIEKLIVCYEELQNKYKKLVVDQKSSLSELEIWKTQYISFGNQFDLLYKDIKREVSQESAKRVDNLQNELQESAATINSLIFSLKEERLKLCASEISNGEIESALQTLSKLGDNSFVPTIIEKAFNSSLQTKLKQNNKKKDLIDNIVQFMMETSNSTNTILEGWERLIKQMDSQKQIKGSKIFIVDFHLKQIENSGVIKLRKEISKPLEQTLIKWSQKLQNDSYEPILTFAKKNPQIFINYLCKLIDTTYAGNEQHYESIRRLLMDAENANIAFFGYTYLLDGFLKHNHTINIIDVVFQLKVYMSRIISKEYSTHIEFVKKKIPIGIKNLIFDGLRCKVKSKRLNEYLYAAINETAYDGDRRNVFTWRQKDTDGEEFLWNIHPGLLNDQNPVFTIRNVLYSREPLYAAITYFAYDKTRRSVYTWRHDQLITQGFWRIKASSDFQSFTIENQEHNEYLYADSEVLFDEKRRRVFTKMSSTKPINYEWIIECPWLS